ncbi:HAD-IA family hydrolase [Kibdelosporangium persicum]|uniref:Haloacid dehalogenase superfamily, subfamily IA, variant 3 with third motif having DD or ED n=1 Tax=Kibdelosporangium persicum TaxID=2698649 RepID=A0ABX2F0Z8_9PSEU|nr:HAD-IA family hydrolase [Kibdelosporangium persicum]NRN64991.1 Haloacid dehalogenase superfamily, subfamily IA, variant 3 with third motif having DD or ED [Kibdelosporangium persicum]
MTATTRALLIDFDGVLRHRDPDVAARCERDAGLPEGSLLGTAFQPRLLTAAATGVISQREWENEITFELLRQYPEADVSAAVGECFGEIGYIDDEVMAVVDAVRPHATVCLISNATDRLHPDLAALGVADRFDHAVASADLGVTKPDERIFAAGARLAGVPADRCLVIDDSPEHTAAAERIGMAAHTFTSAADLKKTVGEWLDRDLMDRTSPEVVDREAVRVLCLDPEDRVLLMHWRDPVNGAYLWEPTGGGVEPGETYLEAAHRELVEETGFLGVQIGEESIPVRRDQLWRGRRFRNVEQFFVARISADQVTTRPVLTETEVETLVDSRWWSWRELLGTTERIEPADLVPVLRRLVPGGPWRSVTRVVE